MELDVFLTSHAITGDHHHALWHLYAVTGLRRGEALGLMWPDIDFRQGFVRIQRAVAMKGTSAGLGDLKPGASRRSVEVEPEALALPRAWRKQQLADRLDAGPLWKDTGLVFTDELGEFLHPVTTSRRFATLVREIEGMRIIWLHELRHTHATLLLADGASVKDVAARLGHDATMTLRLYGFVMEGAGRKLAERFERVRRSGVDASL